MIRLLFIDDDSDFLKGISTWFTKSGFTVYTATNSMEALHLIIHAQPECIILDIDIPEKNGYEICEKIREKFDTPIIFLSNFSDRENRLTSFLSGGDDYLQKPCDNEELKLRIYARIKGARKSKTHSKILNFSPLIINATSMQVFYQNKNVDLTTTETKILLFLAENHPNTFSASEIYQNVWELPDLGNIHTVQVQISRLRQKLNVLSPDYDFIQTSWGKGYRFIPLET